MDPVALKKREPVTVLFATPDVGLGLSGRVLITVWRGLAQRPHFDVLHSTYREMAGVVGERLAVLCVVEEGAPPPRAEDMEFVRSSYQALGDCVACLAGVFETERDGDVVHAAAEEMSRGLPFPTRLCTDVAEACAWTCKRLTAAPEPSDRQVLAEAIEAVRRAIPWGLL